MKLPAYLEDLNPDLYLTDNYVVLDFETTNLDKGDGLNPENNIVLACWYYQGKWKHIWGTEFDMLELVKDIEACDVLVVHNAKFELKWLERCGVDIHSTLVYDTLLAEYVRQGNLKKLTQLGLGLIAQDYGYPGKAAYVETLMKLGVCPSQLPASLLLSRCYYDIQVTRGVFLQQREVLNSQKKLPTLYTRCIFTPVLVDIEKVGICLDAEEVTKEYNKVTKAYNILDGKLLELSDGTNWNSPKQVAVYVYDVLGFQDTHERGTAGAVLKGLKVTNKKQKDFMDLYLKHANLNAKLTKTLNKFKLCIDKGDLLFASLLQGNTVTHRIASKGKKYGVQFQNIPREYKRLITAREKGWKIAEIDGAQLEFRIAAFLGQDERAVDDIRHDFDVHRFTASVINGCTEAEVTKDQRTAAKADTFKPLTLAA